MITSLKWNSISIFCSSSEIGQNGKVAPFNRIFHNSDQFGYSDSRGSRFSGEQNFDPKEVNVLDWAWIALVISNWNRHRIEAFFFFDSASLLNENNVLFFCCRLTIECRFFNVFKNAISEEFPVSSTASKWEKGERRYRRCIEREN